MDTKTFTIKEFCDELGITKNQLLELTRTGKVPETSRDPGTNFRQYTPSDLSVYRKALNIEPLIRSPQIHLFLNFKGGTGKTTISTSYAYRIAEMGYKTLIIDLDPQGHVSKCLGYDAENLKLTLYNVLINKLDISKIIQKSNLETLDFIPSNLNLTPVEISLVSQNNREWKIKRALREIEGNYDIIVFDAPPNMGILNLNAILSSDIIIIPVLADFLSFHGLKILFETLADIEEDFEFFLDSYILLNKYNALQNICNDSMHALKDNYPENLLDTIIRQDTKLAETCSIGKPIYQFAPSTKAAKDIQALIYEIFEQINSENTSKNNIETA